MRRAKLTPAARADLLEILAYIAEATQGVRVAQRYVKKIRDHCHHLASLPFQRGVLRPDLAPELRSIPLENYILILRYIEDRLQIINILEGHRDIPEYFSVAPPE